VKNSITSSITFEEDSQTKQTVAVVLPTYCEAENIESLIREIQQLKLDLMITVIDDSSPDGTAEMVKELQKEYSNILLFVRSKKNGLGTAITAAFRLILSLENRPDYIVTLDADYSHDPKDIPRLIQAAKRGYDLVIGSRYCEGGRIRGWRRARRLISRVANLLASAIIGGKICDCTSGLRCYSEDYIKIVLPNLHSQTYEIQIETIKQAWIQGFRVGEIPIIFENRKSGKSKLTTAEFWAFLSYIAKTKFGDFVSFF
jgi:dolichol-phosphate mannosyltransferase